MFGKFQFLTIIVFIATVVLFNLEDVSMVFVFLLGLFQNLIVY